MKQFLFGKQDGKNLGRERVILLVLAGIFLLLPVSAEAEFRILCLGDSLTEGYGVDASYSYPSRLEKIFHEKGRKEIRVINAGVSGATTASALPRLKWQLKSRPDLLILALGANDGLRGLPLDEIRKNLRQAIEFSKENGIEVVLAGMKLPPNYGGEYTEGFEKIYPDLASEYEIPLIPFLLEGVAGQPEMNQPDGIHPTAKGYEVITDTVLHVVEPLL